MTLTRRDFIKANAVAATAVAAGIANAKAINKVKAPGAEGGAAPNISVPTGPVFNPEVGVQGGDNTITPEGQTTTTVNNQPVVKAYVISSDVTSQQEADAKINDLARL